MERWQKLYISYLGQLVSKLLRLPARYLFFKWVGEILQESGSNPLEGSSAALHPSILHITVMHLWLLVLLDIFCFSKSLLPILLFFICFLFFQESSSHQIKIYIFFFLHWKMRSWGIRNVTQQVQKNKNVLTPSLTQNKLRQPKLSLGKCCLQETLV